MLLLGAFFPSHLAACSFKGDIPQSLPIKMHLGKHGAANIIKTNLSDTNTTTQQQKSISLLVNSSSGSNPLVIYNVANVDGEEDLI